ncbi:hypothetical protein TYRP_005156 [Tyrophagus putrescentiae]|nr:hypothetical protein TYRP_005156 [Tyrophagus putrescentiae]
MFNHCIQPLLPILLLLLVQQQPWLTTAAPATAAPAASTTVTTTKPLLSASPVDQKASSSEEDGSTAAEKAPVAAAPATTAGNGNVYGADNTATTDQAGGAKPRGYNQGYSYNTGIKPYRTGYTYFQPFGDAADQQNQQNGAGGAAAPNAAAAPQTAKAGGAGAAAPPPPPLPVELPNFFGLDPKTMGPMRVIPNQNVPVDENGIPNLDAIQIPVNNGQQAGGGKAAAPVAIAPAAPAINPAILGGGGGVQQPVQQPVQQQQFASNPANDNSMFDFAPPAAQNFDLPTNGGSNDGRDYNRLDNFAGNLNNFDTYLGDGSLPMIGAGNSGGGGNGGGGDGLGDGEIANLNNAFGANTNQASNNDMINILNQLNGGAQPQQQQPNGNEMDFGNFGNAATNRNQFFPFF